MSITDRCNAKYYIQIVMYPGEIGVEQNVIDNFLIEKVRSCPIFGLLLLMAKIFF